MSKLSGSTALSRRKHKDTTSSNRDVNAGVDHSVVKKTEEEKITTVATRRNVTTGTSPVPMRLTENDKAELNLWLSELESASGKSISSAKLMRGLIHMREKINPKKLLDAIKEAS